MKIDKKISLSLYYQMLKIRMVEEKICELYPEQQMRCPVHLCIGQEGVAAGVCTNLKKDDYVLSNHRSHGHFLAKGGDLTAMIAELYGKASGCSKGKGGSMHLVDSNVNFLGSTPIVAGVIPVAVGVAFGTAMKKEKKVTVVFFGDAATEEGVFCESLNFASLKKLPIIFVCENNFYSVYSPLSVRQPKLRNNISLSKAYGIPAKKGDGNNVLEVYELTREAVSHIKKHGGPYYLEFETYRLREHCGPNYDNELGYRKKTEFDKWKNRCPIQRWEKILIKDRLLDSRKIKEIKSKIEKELEEVVIFAKNSSYPESKEILSDIYAN